MGRRPAAPALVEQQHIVARRVEQAAMIGRYAAARPAVQEHRRLRPRRAGPFPIDMMTVANVEMAGSVRGDRGIKGAHPAILESRGGEGKL